MKIRQIAAGSNYSLALTDSGDLFVWGADITHPAESRTRFVIPTRFNPIPAKISQLSAAQLSASALTEDNEIWMWGWHWSVTIDGYGVTTPRRLDNRSLISAQIAQITFDGNLMFALTETGQVWCWSYHRFYDDRGQLSGPILLPHLENIVSVATAFSYHLALADNGVVWIWIVDNDLSPKSISPFQYTHFTDVKQIAGGSGYSTMLRSDGTVWVFGEHTSLGGLVRQGDPDYLVPTQVQGIEQEIVSVASGVPAGHGMAIARDGSLWGWGRDEAGQVGSGSQLDEVRARRRTATRVSLPIPAENVVLGAAHSLALAHDGSLWAWGSNADGQLGDGTIENRNTPTPVITDQLV